MGRRGRAPAARGATIVAGTAWVAVHAVIGITDYAQDELGDVVFVGLPEPGAEVHAGEPLGEVESTKSVSDIYSPVSGRVVERNTDMESSPELVNSDPYGQGPAPRRPGQSG